MTEKAADGDGGAGGREVAVGRAEAREGEADLREGEADRRDGDAEGEDDADEESEGEGVGDGVAEKDGEIGTCGIDGSTTLGCTVASAGPTARTAIQTTSRTRTAAAALRKIRAGPSGRAECFAGKRATPSVI
ncbi:hypothetical protein ACQPZX_05280 [Actinoplanes sp. CA-142083]|uniref:hypothetical protein n=1 Tax=Actinoplanes sp. CA-142083 TaxID=3239903 RepID=UPI003D8F503D